MNNFAIASNMENHSVLPSDKYLHEACTIIDRMQMRTMLKMDEQIKRHEIENFFKKVGYVTEIESKANSVYSGEKAKCE